MNHWSCLYAQQRKGRAQSVELACGCRWAFQTEIEAARRVGKNMRNGGRLVEDKGEEMRSLQASEHPETRGCYWPVVVGWRRESVFEGTSCLKLRAGLRPRVQDNDNVSHYALCVDVAGCMWDRRREAPLPTLFAKLLLQAIFHSLLLRKDPKWDTLPRYGTKTRSETIRKDHLV